MILNNLEFHSSFKFIINVIKQVFSMKVTLSVSKFKEKEYLCKCDML